MQLSATFCKINSIWVTQLCKTPEAAEIPQQPRKRSGLGGSKAPSPPSCQLCSRSGEEGKVSSRQAQAEIGGWCVLSHLYWGLGAASRWWRDLLCRSPDSTGCRSSLASPSLHHFTRFSPHALASDLKWTSTSSPQFLRKCSKSERFLYPPRSLPCEDSAPAHEFGSVWMQITYQLVALTNTIWNHFFLQRLQVGLSQTRRTTGILSPRCVWHLQGT